LKKNLGKSISLDVFAIGGEGRKGRGESGDEEKEDSWV